MVRPVLDFPVMIVQSDFTLGTEVFNGLLVNCYCERIEKYLSKLQSIVSNSFGSTCVKQAPSDSSALFGCKFIFIMKCTYRTQWHPRLVLWSRGLRKRVRLRKIGSGELQAGKRNVMILGVSDVLIQPKRDQMIFCDNLNPTI